MWDAICWRLWYVCKTMKLISFQQSAFVFWYGTSLIKSAFSCSKPFLHQRQWLTWWCWSLFVRSPQDHKCITVTSRGVSVYSQLSYLCADSRAELPWIFSFMLVLKCWLFWRTVFCRHVHLFTAFERDCSFTSYLEPVFAYNCMSYRLAFCVV